MKIFKRVFENELSLSNQGSEPLISYAKATTWFQFSTAMLIFLAVKLFLVLWFPPQGSMSRRDIFGATLIVLETVFKIFGLFVVKEFIDDLKSLLSMFPTPQFYCVYTPSPSAPFPTAGNNSFMAYPNSNANATPYACASPTAVVPSAPAQALTDQHRNNRDSTFIAVV